MSGDVGQAGAIAHREIDVGRSIVVSGVAEAQIPLMLDTEDFSGGKVMREADVRIASNATAALRSREMDAMGP